MRDRPRRLPLAALGAFGVLIALLLVGTYIHGEGVSTVPESAFTAVVLNTGGSGGGGQTTEVFTVNGDWDLRWSYDCSPGLGNLFRLVDHCDFLLTVMQMSDCQVSPENQGITGHRTKDQGLVHYHAGGTFYFVVESDGGWAATVTGSGQASGVGPAPHCSEA
jgi:hypothetical protein